MSAEDPTTVTVKLLEREYQVACPPDEREKLLASAEYLSERMSAIRKRGTSLGVERVAIMAALNMARELLDSQSKKKRVKDDEIEQRLRQMQLRIDEALDDDAESASAS